MNFLKGSFGFLSVVRSQNLVQSSPTSAITIIPVRTKKSVVKKKKNAAVNPKGHHKPPEKETAAYLPIPHHLEHHVWARRGNLDRKPALLWHTRWIMQRDARKRQLGTYYGPLRVRLLALRMNGFLPVELKQVADQEMCNLPRDCQPRYVRDRCVLTSRGHGNRSRWRMSRIMFRHFADHGHMSGMKRAVWNRFDVNFKE